MPTTPGGSPDGPASPQPVTPPSNGDPLPDSGVRCELCRRIPLIADPDGRVTVLACPEHTRALNRQGNAAVGLTPDDEELEYGDLTGPSPVLASLLPPDGQHWHHTLTLAEVTALAQLRIHAAVAPGR